jgi:adenine-specific DNA-methyltransferase
MTLKKLTANDPETKSPDLVAENIERLKALFPELVTEGPDGAAVNVDVLKQLVGDKTVTDADEKYGLNWFGKRRARQLALTPSTGTLRPCPDESVDWDSTQNLMIEGDNLEVLKLLQKSYAGKVKLIYIDPPYNTGKDFVYPDDYKDNIKNYLELTGQTGEGGKKLSSNTEASGRFHTDWLNMMYPRLKLARNLLSDDGMIFISIDDNEAASLRKICDDVFGEENYRNEVIVRRGAKSVQAQFDTWDKLGSGYERVLFYSKKADYRFPQQRRSLEDTRPGSWNNHWRGTDRPSMRYQLLGITPEQGQWRWSQSRSEIAVSNYKELLSKLGKTEETITQEEIDSYYMERIDEDLDFIRLSPNGKPEHYIPPSDSVLLNDIWFDLPTSSSKEVQALFDRKKVFDNPKQTRLSQRILDFSNDNAVILDFFAGSGTTAHAVMAQNAADGGKRRFILVQLPEPLDPENKDQKVAAEFCDKLGKPRNIAELTKERLRRAAKKIKDENPLFSGDLGFRVFKLDSSNIRAWEPDRDDLDKTLLDSVEHLKEGRTEADVLYELLLKLGLDLCVPIETRTIAGKEVHAVGGGVLMACLAETITRDDVEALAQGIVEWHKELAPAGDTTCVFRDSAFADDVAKTNLAAILEQHGIANVRSL